MHLGHWLSVLGFLCACESLASPAGDAGVGSGPQAEPEPLPPDLVAACPESERFERQGASECTEIGCQSGYSLNVSPSSGWASGAYRFELTVDDRPVECTGSIPLGACPERSFRCNADGVRLGESGCALEPTEQGIASIAFEGFPLSISMRVLRDGSQLVNAELTPVYSAAQPNGPGCDPICCGASDELNIPARP